MESVEATQCLDIYTKINPDYVEEIYGLNLLPTISESKYLIDLAYVLVGLIPLYFTVMIVSFGIFNRDAQMNPGLKTTIKMNISDFKSAFEYFD